MSTSSYQHTSARHAKKAEMKMRKSPCTPLRVKAKGKETSRVCRENATSPRARVREEAVGRFRLAGGAAEELIAILGARRTVANVKLWSFYCNHFDIETILEKARECASRHRQGEIRYPVPLFQKWLTKTFAKEA